MVLVGRPTHKDNGNNSKDKGSPGQTPAASSFEEAFSTPHCLSFLSLPPKVRV